MTAKVDPEKNIKDEQQVNPEKNVCSPKILGEEEKRVRQSLGY